MRVHLDEIASRDPLEGPVPIESSDEDSYESDEEEDAAEELCARLSSPKKAAIAFRRKNQSSTYS